MYLTKEQVNKLQKLFYKKTGVKLNFRDALKIGSDLVDSVKTVYKPITKVDYGKQQPLL